MTSPAICATIVMRNKRPVKRTCSLCGCQTHLTGSRGGNHKRGPIHLRLRINSQLKYHAPRKWVAGQANMAGKPRGSMAESGGREALAIRASGLSKAYGPHLVLRGLDLSLPWGEFLTVFGPNGSGKTTLIKVLATIARSDTARAVLRSSFQPS